VTSGPGAEPKVLIVGAGLGGLAAAVALTRRGVRVEVYEQATALGEVGAGLTVSRGAQRVLAELGVLEDVRAQASLTQAMAFLHFRTGALLDGGYDRSDGTADDGRAGGVHIHRADLHRILTDTLARQAPGALRLGRRLVGLDDDGDRVTARFADGSAARGDIVVGADGLHSTVRGLLWGQAQPRFTGQVAFRCLIPGAVARPYLAAAGRAAVYFGPGRVFNRYTLRRGAIVNCVAIARTDRWREEGYTAPAAPEELIALYQGWHPDVLGLLGQAPRQLLNKWALYDREPLACWRQGRVTLLGDAAHPMLPFLGLGAAMALEDGGVLARALEPGAGPAALDRYEQARRPRTELVMRESRREGQLVQSRDPSRYDADAAPSRNPAYYDFDLDHALA
jgi:salicylate hydroxylase